MGENGSNGALLWKTLGPILLPAVIALTVGWFAFQRDTVSMAEHVRLLADVKSMETLQNQQTTSVMGIPALRTEVTNLSVKVAVLQSQLDSLRRGLQESRFPTQGGKDKYPLLPSLPEEIP